MASGSMAIRSTLLTYQKFVDRFVLKSNQYKLMDVPKTAKTLQSHRFCKVFRLFGIAAQ